MKADGMEVRNSFWLRTGTPFSESCISRTSDSICKGEKRIAKYVQVNRCTSSLLPQPLPTLSNAIGRESRSIGGAGCVPLDPVVVRPEGVATAELFDPPATDCS